MVKSELSSLLLMQSFSFICKETTYCTSISNNYNFGQYSVFVHSINAHLALISTKLYTIRNKR